MNKKVKALVGSALAIAMSMSVAAAGTFALFTDKAEVNVAITAGTVDVEASVANLKLYSMDREQPGMVFENLGTADYNSTDNLITLTNITPGDKIVFDVNLSSLSNVKTKVRTVVADASDSQELMSGLKVKVNGADVAISGGMFTSGWKTVEPTGLATGDDKMTVSIELPADRGNEYQGKIAKLRISIEAVQWNGIVDSADTLTTMLASNEKTINVDGVINGDTHILPWEGIDAYTAEYVVKDKDLFNGGEIVMDGGKVMGMVIADTAEISNTTLTGKQSKSVAYIESANKALVMNNVTVNAENSNGLWIESTAPGVVLNNVTVKQSGIKAGVNSWHESAIEVGQNSNLTINSGYYESSKYALYALDSTSQTTIVTINGGTFKGEIVSGLGNEIIINGGTFSVNPSTLDRVTIPETSSVYDNGDGTWTVKSNVVALTEALAQGGVVTLSEDMVIADVVKVEKGVNATLNLNGKKITLAGEGREFAIDNYGTLVVKDGTIEVANVNGGSAIRNYGTIEVSGMTLDGAPFGGDATVGWPSYVVNNYGTAVISDTTIVGDHGGVAGNEGSTTTLNNVNVTVGVPSITSNGVIVYATASFIINGGSYNLNAGAHSSCSTVRAMQGSTFVTDGTAVFSKPVWDQSK
ncbi:MAG: hypothetical protein J6C23_01860 [Clostridia bacterium]|nr:hypothetical protein [Clostridia bacterium]